MNKKITATGQVDLELTDPQTIGAIVFNLAISGGGTFSLIPQYQKQGVATYENVPYSSVAGTAYTAGTAITEAGVGTYEAQADSGLISLIVSAISGTLTVTYNRVAGAGGSAGSGGGGGGAVTIANGADVALGSTTDAVVTSASGSAATAISLLKGIDNAVNFVPTVPLPTTIYDATGTTTPSVIAASTAITAAAPAFAVAISPNNSIALNATPTVSSQVGIPVYASIAVQNSGVAQPIKTSGRVGAGDTGNNSMSVGCVRWSSSTTWDPETNNTAVTLLASAARTTTQTSADLVNYNSRAIHVILDTTVNAGSAGSVTVTINGKDPASGKYYLLLAGAAVTTVTTNVYKVGLGFPVTTNVSASDFVPRVFQVVVTANNANSVTYSVGYNLLS